MNCPRCETVELKPVISEDGTAWEGNECPACSDAWWFTFPKDASKAIPNDKLDAYLLTNFVYVHRGK